MKTWIYLNVNLASSAEELVGKLPKATVDRQGLLGTAGIIDDKTFIQRTIIPTKFWKILGEWVVLRIFVGEEIKLNPLKGLGIELKELGASQLYDQKLEVEPILKPKPLLVAYNQMLHQLAILGIRQINDSEGEKAKDLLEGCFKTNTTWKSLKLNPANVKLHTLYQTLKANGLNLFGYNVKDFNEDQLILVKTGSGVKQTKAVEPTLAMVEQGNWKLVSLRHPDKGWRINLYQISHSYIYLYFPDLQDTIFTGALDFLIPLLLAAQGDNRVDGRLF